MSHGPVAFGQLRNGDANSADQPFVQAVALASAIIASTAHVLTPRCSAKGFARVPTRQWRSPSPGAVQGADALLRFSVLLHLNSYPYQGIPKIRTLGSAPASIKD